MFILKKWKFFSFTPNKKHVFLAIAIAIASGGKFMGSRRAVLCMAIVLLFAHDRFPAFLSHDEGVFPGNESPDRRVL
jgi:hypothetical protein